MIRARDLKPINVPVDSHSQEWQPSRLDLAEQEYLARCIDDPLFENISEREWGLTLNENCGRIHTGKNIKGKRISRTPKSGYTGVYSHHSKGWRAMFYRDGKPHCVGVFETAKIASVAREKALKEYLLARDKVS